MKSITLTPREIIQGAFVGIMRQVENLKRGRSDAHGCSEDFGWQYHIEGALGEMALAKLLGRFWSGAHGFRDPDIDGWEVRTRSRHHYDLIVHPDDRNDARFVLLTGKNGQYRVHGWMWGKDCKQDRWWSDPAGGRAAFFVPQSALSQEHL